MGLPSNAVILGVVYGLFYTSARRFRCRWRPARWWRCGRKRWSFLGIRLSQVRRTQLEVRRTLE